MTFMITFWGVVVALLIGLSLRPALCAKSWKRFFLSAALSAAGILFPLFVFVMSMFLMPEWKGGCRHGWIDCFHIGKLALIPLLLWACAAFYVAQILRPAPKPRIWVDSGLLVGATVSAICLFWGLMIHAFRDDFWGLIVPFYVSVWYAVLYIRAARASGFSPLVYPLAFLGSIPFWIAAVFWSKKYYQSLPDNPPDCFVVTAALRGHSSVVGPITMIERRGVYRAVNTQLQTFWRFERLWSARYPRTHHAFRRGYDHVGPIVAAHIKSTLAADAVYVLLKPLEVLAWLASQFCSENIPCSAGHGIDIHGNDRKMPTPSKEIVQKSGSTSDIDPDFEGDSDFDG